MLVLIATALTVVDCCTSYAYRKRDVCVHVSHAHGSQKDTPCCQWRSEARTWTRGNTKAINAPSCMYRNTDYLYVIHMHAMLPGTAMHAITSA